MRTSHIKLFLIFRKSFCKQKSRHIDSTNSGKTFHPLAQFALKLCNGLKLKHKSSVCCWPSIGLYFFGQIICVGIKPISKKYVFQLILSFMANTLFTNLPLYRTFVLLSMIFYKISCRFTWNSSYPGITPQRCLAHIIAKSYHFQTVIKFSRCIKAKKSLPPMNRGKDFYRRYHVRQKKHRMK